MERVKQLEDLLEEKSEANEQYTRLNNLRFFGVIEEPNEHIKEKIMEICKERVKVEIKEADIDCCHRLSGNNSSNFPRPVIVRFVRRDVKQEIYRNKKKLSGTKITIREDLTAARHRIVKMAVARLGSRNVWTSNAKILIKYNDEIIKIGNEKDLNRVLATSRPESPESVNSESTS